MPDLRYSCAASCAAPADRDPVKPTIGARLDRLPGCRTIWRLVVLVSLGGAFEYYDVFFTGYVAPGMIRAGLFDRPMLGPLGFLVDWGLQGVGSFVFATFAGLFVGALLLGRLADRLGRRTVFALSMIWYSAANLALAVQSNGFSIDLCRLIGGIGLGVQLVTIDTFIAELVPARLRGRAFALSSAITFCAVPVIAMLAWLLVPYRIAGIDGWRIVVALGSFGGVLAWLLLRALPESPRWLVHVGRLAEAEAITAGIERAVVRETGRELAEPNRQTEDQPTVGRIPGLWTRGVRGRVAMLSGAQFCQTVGFYGFAAWVPSLLLSKGILITHSLRYSFLIAIANPVGPLLAMLVADRMERKWQICCAAACLAGFGLLFAASQGPAALIALGVAVTLSANWMSYGFHGYQAEIFDTRIRSRAVGFVYSWSRLSAALAGLAIDYLLKHFGVPSVFWLITGAMAIVVGLIGAFGPPTAQRDLDGIAR